MSEVRDKSPWFGTAEEGLRWILRPETCANEQIKLVAAKAHEHIEELRREKAQNWPGGCGHHCEACARRDDRIKELKQRLKDTEFLYHGYFVLASEKDVKPGSRELMEAAGRFDEALGTPGGASLPVRGGSDE